MAYGIDVRKMLRALYHTPGYLRSFVQFRRLQGQGARDWPASLNYPQLSDQGESGGATKGHYFHQDVFVAQLVHARNPRRHIDVGSRVDGFVAHVASFRDIEVLDIRPNVPSVHRIKFAQCDLMSPPAKLTSICDSLSCLHALEHFGLGRYGDPLDAEGSSRGLTGLARLLEPGGILYLSVPIGHQRIEFNAHRVFAVEHVLNLASKQFDLQGFAYVDDAGKFHSTDPADAVHATHQLVYGCGIFELRKKNS